MKEINIVPELKAEYRSMGLFLRQKVLNYIMLFGTECLEKLLNDLFEGMQIKNIKIRSKHKMTAIEKGLKGLKIRWKK